MVGRAPGPAARPTMRDVAALAGVALKTVSRVVNGVSTVDPALQVKVASAIEMLGYRPNLAANLRGSRSNMIGLLLEDIGNPYSAAVHRAVEDQARARGVLVLAASLDEDPVREHHLVERLIDHRVDGLIVMPAGEDHRYLVTEQHHGVRFVFVDRSPNPLLADAIVSDNVEGARVAVRHLRSHGHRRIAYLGDDPAIATERQRFSGYVSAVGSADEPPGDNLVVHGLRSSDDARAAVRRLCDSDDPPDAFFTSQNLVTIGAVGALHALGLQTRVALVGFDDISFGDLVTPGITVIAQNTEKIGALAAQRLFSRIDGDDGRAELHVVATRLIQRGSGEIARRAD